MTPIQSFAVINGERSKFPSQFHISVNPKSGHSREFVEVVGNFKDALRLVAEKSMNAEDIISTEFMGKSARFSNLDSLQSHLTEQLDLTESYRELRSLGFHFLHGRQFVKQYLSVDHFFLDEIEQEDIFYKVSCVNPFKWPGSFKQFYTLKQRGNEDNGLYYMEFKPAEVTIEETRNSERPYPYSKKEQEWVNAIQSWEKHLEEKFWEEEKEDLYWKDWEQNKDDENA